MKILETGLEARRARTWWSPTWAGESESAVMPRAGAGRRLWLIVATCGGVTLAAHLLLLGVVSDLQTAEPSYAGQVFRWVPLLTRESMVKHQDSASIRFILLVLTLFAAYGFALAALGQRPSRRFEKGVFLIGGLCLAIQVMQPAMLSTDVYAYAMYGRIFGLYGGDPYIQVHGQYGDDPYMPLTYFLPWPSWYGPLWTLISAGLALVGGDRIGLTVLLFRMLGIGAALGAGALIWASLRRMAPERAAQGLVFFLWNPLLILESGMGAHNDAFVAALLVLAVWLCLRGRRVLPLVALTLSVLVKVVTGVLLPLYILFVLRQLRRWPERGRFVLLSGAASLGVATALFGLARTGPLVPVVQSASAAYFYDNNLYQILFPLLRIQLGEEPESARVPVHFYPWWALTQRTSSILSGPDSSAEAVERVRPGTMLLVIAPEDQRWARVYDLANGREGYLPEDTLAKTARPDERANSDPLLGRLELNPAAGPIGRLANDWIRVLTWPAFAAVWLLAAWRAGDLRRFVGSSSVVLLAVYWLLATEIWPWYAIWALALGALICPRRPAVLAALLSATVLSLYVTIGYERSAQSWLFTYRSLPAFGLPLVAFWLVYWVPWRGLAWPRAPRESGHARASG